MNNYDRISPVSGSWDTLFDSQESGKKRRHTSDRKPRAQRISNHHSSASSSTPLLLNPSIVKNLTSSPVSESSVASFVIDDMLAYNTCLPVPALLQPFFSDGGEVTNELLPRGTSLPLPTREQIVVNVVDGLTKVKH